MLAQSTQLARSTPLVSNPDYFTMHSWSTSLMCDHSVIAEYDRIQVFHASFAAAMPFSTTCDKLSHMSSSQIASSCHCCQFTPVMSLQHAHPCCMRVGPNQICLAAYRDSRSAKLNKSHLIELLSCQILARDPFFHPYIHRFHRGMAAQIVLHRALLLSRRLLACVPLLSER